MDEFRKTDRTERGFLIACLRYDFFYQLRDRVAAPFGGPTSSGMLTLHCPPDKVYALTSFLRENGAEAVAVADLDYVFSKENPLYAKLEAAL